MKTLGRGGFGTVYQASSSSIDYVAIKEIEKSASKDEEAQKKVFINELKRLNGTKHERIIKFYGISLDKKTKAFYLVMEFANNGNLREYLQKNKLEWPEKIQLARQISEGMSYLHSIEIIHRDLVNTLRIFLSITEMLKFLILGFQKNLDSIAVTSSKEFCGVIPFIDPRKLKDQKYPYDKKSDVYSIGVLLWEISSNGQPPFSHDSDNNLLGLSLKITTEDEGSRERPIAGTPKQYIDLYEKCWDDEPNKRPSMIQIFQKLNSLVLDPNFFKQFASK
ncbi:kinase-like domain-containing protein [Gigaspora rosea]|uniref:Kinase-like domain-containing protein n=1 Tax=Gigaspora rosea TaxID=44941 RepID=A0A397UB90_9GLOM|nr:kinase-like domain-containing protein [Gigaspora rosea]